MDNVRQKLLSGYSENNLFDVILSLTSNLPNTDDIGIELANLHNQNQFDILEIFSKLKNDSNNSFSFFIIKDTFEKALPLIEAPTSSVMQCVLKLFHESLNDGAAGLIFNCFVDFCKNDRIRISSALEIIIGNPEHNVDLLLAVLIAGSQIDPELYLKETLELSKSDNIKIKKIAILAIGKMKNVTNKTLLKSTFIVLDNLLKEQNDDEICAAILRSTFYLFHSDPLMTKKMNTVIGKTLSQGNDITLHAASEILWLNFSDISPELLDIALSSLKNVDISNKRTLDVIDNSIDNILKSPYSNKGVQFLEEILLKNRNELSLMFFDSVVRTITKDNKILGTILTRWLYKGDKTLCSNLTKVFESVHQTNLMLSIDINEINVDIRDNLVFLARKAVGYLFNAPITVASIILSIMRNTNDISLLNSLVDLLVDPILYNYPNIMDDYLKDQLSQEKNELVKTCIVESIAYMENYFSGLKEAHSLTELFPSQEHANTQRRYFLQLMTDAYKKAEQESIFLKLIPKSILLYGQKSINYIHGPDGDTTRIENTLQSHSTSIALPRLENIDPITQDYFLRVCRSERFLNEIDN